MTYTYPEVTTIDTFYTTADGDLITPQTLNTGRDILLWRCRLRMDMY